MHDSNGVRDRTLERQGRVLGRSSERLLSAGAILVVPGIVLIVFTSTWAYGIGWALVALGGGPLVVGAGLLLSGLVSRWSARHRSFA